MQMGIFRANPKGRVFPGGLFCREARQGDQPLASLPFAHPIPESLRRNPVESFNSLLDCDYSASNIFSDGGRR